MANPFLLMAVLYLALALLAALYSALVNLGLTPWFTGVVWLRAHFITLGALTQVAFGILPLLIAAHLRRPRPPTRWDIWLALNAGLALLAVGIPLVNGTLIIMGGTLVLLAAVLLLKQLLNLRAPDAQAPLLGTPPARKFYIAGLSYLLLGIFVGTGLFVGWGVALGMHSPREVHVHANMWGFTSLVFAGLWVDLYPALTGRTFAWPRSIRWIFWLMTLGGLVLVLGPWTGSNMITAPGLVLYFASTLLLLANVIRPLGKDRSVWAPGLLHMVIAYAWVAAPVAMAPLFMLSQPGFDPNAVEPIALSILMYGWLLQFAYGLFPYLFSRMLLPEQAARLGGNAVSLIGVNLGAVLMLASAFLESFAATLTTGAFLAWAVSLVPIALQLWQTVQVAGDRESLLVARDAQDDPTGSKT